MHEMQAVAVDAPVNQSVCLSSLGFDVQKTVEQIGVLFGMKIHGGQRNIVLDGGPDPLPH